MTLVGRTVLNSSARISKHSIKSKVMGFKVVVKIHSATSTLSAFRF